MALISPGTAEVLILVEGESDQAAVATAAATLGCDLEERRAEIRVLGGATNFDRALSSLKQQPELDVVGLCDANEADLWHRVVEQHGRLDAEIYVCDRDLEDELLRACGLDRVERYIESVDEGRPLRTMRKQAPWVDKPGVEQLRRFIGAKATRKVRYGAGLTALLEPHEIPAPIADLLRSI